MASPPLYKWVNIVPPVPFRLASSCFCIFASFWNMACIFTAVAAPLQPKVCSSFAQALKTFAGIGRTLGTPFYRCWWKEKCIKLMRNISRLPCCTSTTVKALGMPWCTVQQQLRELLAPPRDVHKSRQNCTKLEMYCVLGNCTKRANQAGITVGVNHRKRCQFTSIWICDDTRICTWYFN